MSESSEEPADPVAVLESRVAELEEQVHMLYQVSCNETQMRLHQRLITIAADGTACTVSGHSGTWAQDVSDGSPAVAREPAIDWPPEHGPGDDAGPNDGEAAYLDDQIGGMT